MHPKTMPNTLPYIVFLKALSCKLFLTTSQEFLQEKTKVYLYKNKNYTYSQKNETFFEILLTKN